MKSCNFKCWNVFVQLFVEIDPRSTARTTVRHHTTPLGSAHDSIPRSLALELFNKMLLKVSPYHPWKNCIFAVPM